MPIPKTRRFMLLFASRFGQAASSPPATMMRPPIQIHLTMGCTMTRMLAILEPSRLIDAKQGDVEVFFESGSHRRSSIFCPAMFPEM